MFVPVVNVYLAVVIGKEIHGCQGIFDYFSICRGQIEIEQSAICHRISDDSRHKKNMMEPEIGPGEDDPFAQLLRRQIASDFEGDGRVNVCPTAEESPVVVERRLDKAERPLKDGSSTVLSSTPCVVVVGVAAKPMVLAALLLHVDQFWGCSPTVTDGFNDAANPRAAA